MVAQFVNDTFGVHGTRITQWVSVASDASKLVLVLLFRCSVPLIVVVLYLVPIPILRLAHLILRRNLSVPS